MKKSESRESSAVIKQEALCEQEYLRTDRRKEKVGWKGLLILGSLNLDWLHFLQRTIKK